MRPILYISNTRLPTPKARGLQIMKSCEAFADQGVEVFLITPGRQTSDPFAYYGVKRTFKLTNISSPDFRWLSHVSGRLNFYARSFFFTFLALFSSRKLAGRAILYSRDYFSLFVCALLNYDFISEIHDYRSQNEKWMINYFLGKSKKIILNSRGTLASLEKHYTLDRSKIRVAPNGVDLDFFDIKESKHDLRSELKMPASGKIIGYVGRLETVGHEKGVNQLIEAFSGFAHEYPGAYLYIIGGPDHIIEKYKREATNSGNITFKGQIDYKLVPKYLKALDTVVVPKPSYGHAFTTSPIKLFESLAAGKVIIAADIDSFRDYLNEENAIFFNPEDKGDLAKKLIQVIENKIDNDKLSENALRAANGFTWKKRAEKIMEFIRS